MFRRPDSDDAHVIPPSPLTNTPPPFVPASRRPGVPGSATTVQVLMPRMPLFRGSQVTPPSEEPKTPSGVAA
jgi:hypothetical protein